MFEPTLLDHVPLWAFFLIVLAITALIHEYGYRFGRRYRAGIGEKVSQLVDTTSALLAANLGLLSLLLAFTFGLATERYDGRQAAYRAEINAIGTAYLRASFLPEPQATETRNLLSKYVETRIDVAFNKHTSIINIARQSQELHTALWRRAVQVQNNMAEIGGPNPEMLSLFIRALNEVMDAHTTRVEAAYRTRVPGAMWGALFVLTFVAMFSLGFSVGIAESPRPLLGMGMTLCFALTLWLIADLDRPWEGLIRVNQQGLFDLLASMQAR